MSLCDKKHGQATTVCGISFKIQSAFVSVRKD